MQRHIFTGDTTPVPRLSFCSTQCHTTGSCSQDKPQAHEHGDGLGLPLRSGYNRSEEPGVMGTVSKRRADNAFGVHTASHCRRRECHHCLQDGLLRIFSIWVITGLFQSPLKSSEVFPLILVGHVIW